MSNAPIGVVYGNGQGQPIAGIEEYRSGAQSGMKVVLLQPRFDEPEPLASRTESLGLGYIASVLRRDGHEVELLDAQLRNLTRKETVQEVLAREFDCLGITAADAHKKTLISTVRAVRRKRRNAIIVVGGYLPTLSMEQLLAACPEIDFVIRGEGETVASDVFGRISRSEEWRDTPGIAFLKDGAPVLNQPPPLIKDLDSLPFPARDALNQSVAPAPALVSSSRGCYHRCAFCCIHTFYGVSGSRVPRYRSPESVVNEIESVAAATGIKKIGFVDDDFVGPGAKNRERVTRIAEEIRARKLGITFSAEFRADEIDDDLLKVLKEAGLTRVLIGIESGVQRQLGTYNKRITVEQNRRAIETVRRAGLDFSAGFIMLDPYVTVDEIEQNLRFMRETGLSGRANIASVQSMMRLKIFHGLPLTEQLRQEGLLREKGLHLDYVFKDAQFRQIYRMITALGTCSKPLKCLRRLFARRTAA